MMGGPFTTQISLLARISGGTDADAWPEFCGRYGELILGFARRFGLQSSDCDDVMQEVLTSLCQSMPTFQYDPQKGKFRSYLKTIAVHAIQRKFSQKSSTVPLLDTGSMIGQDEMGAAEIGWETEWRRYHLRRAMKVVSTEFSSNDFTAFEAYAMANQDPRRVADSLGLSVDQVYQAKSRIVKRLSSVIAEQVREEG